MTTNEKGFSNEDLKRLKEALEAPSFTVERAPLEGLVKDGRLEALIARMEAAENALNIAFIPPVDNTQVYFRSAYEAWRKSKGEI